MHITIACIASIVVYTMYSYSSSCTVADQDSQDLSTSNDALSTNSTDNNHYTQERVLITLGIGAALMGALIATATNLVVVGTVCCCQIQKRKLKMK